MRVLLVLLFTVILFPAHGKIDDFTGKTTPEIQKMLEAGSVSSEQLVRFYLRRIKQIDQSGPKLNSILLLNNKAIDEAKALDDEQTSLGRRGPLHGIPVLLKGNIDIAGLSNTAGSLTMINNIPEKDAFVVKQLRKAGAVVLGVTNLSEWANFRSTRSSSGWSGQGGQTLNPYDTTRSPCGSSSGSGVAVAADLAPLAIGTETDGSVTCPSAVNGIVGIKPTLGTVSRSGIIPIAHSQDTAGPMAKTVTGAVLLLDAMVGVDPADAQATSGTGNLTKHLKNEGLKGKRIGIVRNLMGYHELVDQVFNEQLKLLEQQGAILVDDLTMPNMDKIGPNEYDVLLYEFKADLNHYLKSAGLKKASSLEAIIDLNNKMKGTELRYFGQEIMEMAQAKDDLDDPKYLKALDDAKRMAGPEGIDALLKENNLDLLIAPTTGPAWKIDHTNGDHYLGSATTPAAVSGYPHITVPMGFVHDLPVGISFFTRHNGEGVLIEAAYHYEQASKARVAPDLTQR